MKCYQCSGYDYLPANVMSQIDDLNITDTDFTSKLGACTKDSYCHNGAFCAKRTVSYKLSVLGVSYKYKTWQKLCTSTRLDGAGGTPSNGQCYNDTSSAGTDGDAATGVSKTSTWCYCNNKDYCNGAQNSWLNSGLLVTIAFVLSAMYVK
ncbi:Protein F35C5.11 [Aphelenchoides avenae]|nr:Protein F35C5.11 [Aphelenchus avenae]